MKNRVLATKTFIIMMLSCMSVLGLKAQSAEETVQYIWSSLQYDNPQYINIKAGPGRLIFTRKPALYECDEYLDLNKADFTYVYKSKSKVDPILDYVTNRTYGLGKYWVYSKSKKLNLNDACINNRLIIKDKETARKVANALNHLSKIMKDPFD